MDWANQQRATRRVPPLSVSPTDNEDSIGNMVLAGRRVGTENETAEQYYNAIVALQPADRLAALEAYTAIRLTAIAKHLGFRVCRPKTYYKYDRFENRERILEYIAEVSQIPHFQRLGRDAKSSTLGCPGLAATERGRYRR